MKRICLNGEYLKADDAVIRADNKSYRYGHGLFETMRCINNSIPLVHLHLERLLAGMQLLGLRVSPHFDPDKLTRSVLKLTELNGCNDSARIRLSVSGGHGGVNDGDNKPDYLVECWPIALPTWNDNGLVTDIFPNGRKAADAYSGLKSASYLLFSMAARWAKDNKVNEAVILNGSDRIAEAGLSNLFIIIDHKIITPPLSEGCVAGIMRRHLLGHMEVIQRPIAVQDLAAAQEIFFTNAIHGIKWVRSLKNHIYKNDHSASIYSTLIQTIWK